MNPETITTEEQEDIDLGRVPPDLGCNPTTTGEWDIIARLQYIADSPSQEHGGFHKNAIQTAKDAITALAAEREQIKQHQAEYDRLSAIIEKDTMEIQQLREQLAAWDKKYQKVSKTR